MNRYWNLRDETYRLFHRWPVGAAFFVAGCLLGWLLSYLWPASFKANRDIYVGLNAYRTYSDTNFLALAKPRYSNIDNYHYWQMNQLNTSLMLDGLLQQTLAELGKQDPYWQSVDVESFRDLLDTDWRTAGEWRLSVSHRDRARALQALEAWSRVGTEQVKSAVDSARTVILTDQDLEQVSDELFAAQRRSQALAASQARLQEWLGQSGSLPADQPLTPLERWNLSSAVASLALDDPAWQELLSSQPAADAPPAVYQAWLELALEQIKLEADALPGQIAALEGQRQALKEKYTSESANSLSLSPNLEIQEIGPGNAQILRPTTTLILVGGFIGLLAWLLVELVRITRRVQIRE
jgi:hypothetical protein